MLRRAAPLLLLGAVLAAAPAQAAAAGRGAQTTEVIVELAPAPSTLARTPASARAALRTVAQAQRGLERRLLAAVPSAHVRWRYRRVLDGIAVVLPESEVGRLAALPGVRRVYPSVTYHALTGQGPGGIGAPAVWGPALEHGGQGVKIGIIDDGIDQTHPFFHATGFSMPAGFPKGNTAFTTAKVIVARAFPPPGAGWRYAGRPFDPVHSEHGTHVAGIAAGDHDTPVPAGSGEAARTVSGVAPFAYLGNYKALTVPTPSGVGLDGNSPEIVAAIEAAVADGMDVINLSLGEPQVTPSRDAVAIALDHAAAAGVIPVVAAGNDELELGRGSVGSPATSTSAIAVAAVDGADVIAPFSASGPSPLGLAPKPDVAAPGVDVLSSLPDGRFGSLSGTSMASPHVAGAAAILRQLHPDWTVEQVKSALVLTGRPVWSDPRKTSEVPSTREGGGLVDLPQAAAPLVFASPQSAGFGYLDVAGGAASARQTVTLTDAGGGAGAWSVAVEAGSSAAGVAVTAPETVQVPGTLTVEADAAAGAAEGERSGFVVLRRDGVTRRLPFWLRVTKPALPTEPFRRLRRTGTYRGNTAGRPARVDVYRYPDAPPGAVRRLTGPEQVFRVVLARPVANLGAAVVRAGRNVHVQPRIVVEQDENRLTGAAALPYVINPYLLRFRSPTASAAALVPAPGTYSVVFDTPQASAAGPFRFRLWIDDTTPPRVRLLSHRAREDRLRARVRDAGSGVDPQGISFRVDGRAARSGTLRGGIALLGVGQLRRGRHRLVLSVSDRQEAKNDENVGGILPNTRVIRTTFRVG